MQVILVTQDNGFDLDFCVCVCVCVCVLAVPLSPHLPCGENTVVLSETQVSLTICRVFHDFRAQL